MKEDFILEDKNYISAKRAAEISNYAADYIGQLCRAGKLEAKMIGRSWFVVKDSIIKHKLSIHPDSVNEIKLVKDIKPANDIKVDTIVPVTEMKLPVAEISSEKVAEKVAEKVSEDINKDVADNASERVCKINKIESEIPNNQFIDSFTHKSTESYKTEPYKKIQNHKLILSAGLCVISLLFVFRSIYIHTDIAKYIDTNIAYNVYENKITSSVLSTSALSSSVLSSSGEILQRVFDFIYQAPTVLTRSIKSMTSTKSIEPIKNLSNNPQNFNGMAVVPSSHSADQDEIIKDRIRNSFSDEVVVNPDSSGTAGIITPVFRKAKSDDFIYVLVPVNSENQ